MEELKNFLKDKGNNNLVVAFLLAFSTVTFVQGVVSTWEMGEGKFWRDLVFRHFIAYAILLLIAWRIAQISK